MDNEQTQIFQYVLLAMLVVGLTASQMIPKMLIGKIDPSLPLKNKMPKYLSAVILRSACLELPGLFACVVTFITGETYLLLLVPLLLILFYVYRPTTNSIAEELNLTHEEKIQLEDPNAIIAEVDSTNSD
jgi:hypothetical protein